MSDDYETGECDQLRAAEAQRDEAVRLLETAADMLMSGRRYITARTPEAALAMREGMYDAERAARAFIARVKESQT